MTTLGDAIDRMADALTVSGLLTDQRWRRSMHAVPRHLFIPERGYAMPSDAVAGPPAQTIDRLADPDAWWRAVYSNMMVITQRDEGAGDPASAEGAPTSSNSAPGVVFPFLELLAPARGERILDVGTGTGWTAALLSDRVGAAHVTSIEIDPQVAARAVENIAAAGYAPTLIVGDGVAGWPSGAPYHGIHVTVGVRDIPYEWLRQLRPGGRIVLPWMTRLSGFKVRLTAVGEARAVGTFHGSAGYMVLRSQQPASGWAIHHRADAVVTRTGLDPTLVTQAPPGADLALVMQVPGLVLLPRVNDRGGQSCFLGEENSPMGAWATCDHSPSGGHTVTQYGERRLWDEVEAAYLRWERWGRPTPDDFRLIVDTKGQRLSLCRSDLRESADRPGA